MALNVSSLSTDTTLFIGERKQDSRINNESPVRNKAKAIAPVTTSGQSHILQYHKSVGDNLFMPFQFVDKRNEIQKN